MDKQQKLKIALPILIIIMAFVWGPVIMGSGSKDKSDNNITRIVSKSPGGIEGEDLISLSRGVHQKKAKSAYKDWGRNPFILGYDSRALVVEGIVWDEENPKAILNGEIKGIGDQVGPNTIVAVTQTSVILRSQDGVIELRLGEGQPF